MTAPEFCRIEERFQLNGIALHLGIRGENVRTMLGPGGRGSHLISDVYGATPPDYEPALIVTDSMAREVLRALCNYYGGAEDSRALRRDYDAERARVDKLIDLAVRPPTVVIDR